MRQQLAAACPNGLLQRLNLHKAAIAFLCFAILTSLAEHPNFAAAPPSDEADLLQLSLEDLGKIKVTTVSRKSENIFNAAAAIHVITQEDIRRSGVNSLPEALRMAPGLEVARPNSRQWAISSRGFNDTFANKLLVLMDGRTLYTPLFSGVFWEEVDTVLEDVDRIEVIRGPGATLWGANAVNGVINILTKSARDTQGLLISGGGGLEERAFGTVRYGGQLGTNAFYRVYAKYFDRDESTLLDGGGGVGDSWWKTQQGFRLDWELNEINKLTLQSDYYYGDFGGRYFLSSFTPPGLFAKEIRTETKGFNTLGRWTHHFSSDSELALQAYYDRTDRSFGIGKELRDTVDIDLQHRFHLGGQHEIVWGGGYRYSVDELSQGPDLTLANPSRGVQLGSAFVQDEIALFSDRLHVTLGTKIEHNDFTGLEVQPSGRIAWRPNNRHTLWGAISRAVRTPSRTERDIRIFVDPGNLLPPSLFPILVALEGNRDFDSEELLAYEMGYRVEVVPRLILDVAAFYNDYDRIRALKTSPLEFQSTPSPHLLIPVAFNNDLYGASYGTEASVTWQPFDRWRLRAGYTYLQMDLKTRGATPSVTELVEKSGVPEHQFLLWSDADLGRHVEWGIGVRHVDELKAQLVAGYTALETRLAWKPTPNIELALIGRDLLDPEHREFAPSILTFRRVEVDRAVYGKLTLRF
jgi:iron complex outermembrane recepter protein